MEFLTEEEREQFEVFHYTESEKNKLRSFDYFKKTDLYCREKEKNSILVCGKQQKETPFVSIILTTYKRPKLMIEAINSIIEQKDFTDYEIIICDNEGVALEIETETQKAVKELNNSHILYYRNVVTVTNNFDRGVSLASGEWICFLHDDDILDKKYLKTMTTIVKRYPEIDWLSCGTKGFTDMLPKNVGMDISKVNIYKKNKKYFAFWFDGKWQGAFIRRAKYVEMGGFPTYNSGMSDYVMTAKFAFYYNHYECDAVLYYTRIWGGQDSSRSAGLWINIYIKEYYFYLYAVLKYFRTAKLLSGFWNNICLYQILNKIDLLARGSHGFKIRKDIFCRLIDRKELVLPRWKKAVYYLVVNYYNKNRKFVDELQL